MKDIKSILIGVFATTCLFLFMGQTNNNCADEIEDLEEEIEDLEDEISGLIKRHRRQESSPSVSRASSSNDNSNGRYQVSTTTMGGTDIVITILDTQTGKIIKNERSSQMNWMELIDAINK